MRTLTTLFVLVILLASTVAAQSGISTTSTGAVKSAIAEPVALDLAKAVLAAHGGEKLRGIRTLIVRGDVGITTTAFNQELPATFAMIFSGEKYRLDLLNPLQPIKQVFDGKNTSTTIQNGFELPPLNRVGFIMLSKIGDPEFPITSLPSGAKKRTGFRITSPEGFYTDYIVDEKTNRLKGYESSYDVNGRIVTTSVEIDKFRIVNDIVIPERFSQRFDLGQLTAYAGFKAKEIVVNSEIDDEVFSLAK